MARQPARGARNERRRDSIPRGRLGEPPSRFRRMDAGRSGRTRRLACAISRTCRRLLAPRRRMGAHPASRRVAPHQAATTAQPRLAQSCALRCGVRCRGGRNGRGVLFLETRRTRSAPIRDRSRRAQDHQTPRRFGNRTQHEFEVAHRARPQSAHGLARQGEAYFRIQHDSARPFVLMVQGRRLVDLGTEFLVKTEPKRLEVALVAGRAQLDSPNDPTQEPAVLTPGDVAIATANAISVTAKSTKALSDELSWRQGVLVFKYTTLADAAAEFNRYNYKKIVIADPKIAQLTIVG